MEKTELLAKIKDLRASLAAKRIEHVKGELKDTSSLRKMKKELAALLYKLNAMQHGS
ncbi:MAG: 50S ribosomal protein L29 [Candidatus Dojkabacteria bacterium]|nr:MAG: 50S ribosomal protein L29 [Candidatus Dojkabacteria bacterium]